MALALIATAWIHDRNRHAAREGLELAAGRVAAQVETRLAQFQYGLRGARGAVATVGEDAITSEVFRRYSSTRDMAREFPGARGFGFVRRVRPDGLADFLRAARAGGGPGVALRELSPNPGERFIVQLIEPVEPNREAVGLDIASEPERRAAAVRAMEGGEVAMTGPITLVQAPDKGTRGFLAFLPVLAPDRPDRTVEERAAATVGWSFVPFAIDEVLAGLDGEGLAYALDDVTTGGHSVFFRHGGIDGDGGDTLSTHRSVRVFDRTWRMDFRTPPGFVGRYDRPWPMAVGAATSLLGLLCASMAYLMLVGRARAVMAATQNDRLAAIVGNADEAILGKALDGTVTDWNPAAERLFGYPAAFAVGRKAVDLIFPPHLHAEEAATLAAIGMGERVPAHATTRRHRDGGTIHVLASAFPIRGAGGALVGAASLMRDIGERVANDERIAALTADLERQVAERTAELRTTTAAQSAILDNAGYAIIATDREGTITVFNPAAERMLGYPAPEVVGRATPMLFHDAAEVAERARRLSAEYGEPVAPGPAAFVIHGRHGKQNLDEWTYIDRAGARRPVLLNVAELKSPAGEPLGYLGIAMDLSERRRHAAEMRSAGAGTWSYDIGSGRVWLSAECARQHGLADAETEIDVETEWRRLVDPDDARRVAVELAGAIEAGGGYEIEFRVPIPGGGARWLMSVGRVEIHHGAPTGRVIGLTLDITRRKEVEEALVAARRDAEAANRSKGEFLATMSHEIRTPLNAIVGFTNLMLGSGRMGAIERRHAELVKSAGSALLTVVNDVLDFARIEAGAVTLDPGPFSPESLADNCVSIVRNLAEQKGLTLVLDLDPDLPPCLMGDKPRLRQILLNLLNNAVKFTHLGTVTLRVRHQGTRPDGETLRFSVLDTGIGIPDDKRDRLFHRFSQVDASVEREFGGTGLGLAICKALVDLMSGEIGVESDPGRGSTFWFELCLRRAEAGSMAEVPVSQADRRRGRLLLVEDNPVNRELAVTVLRNAGHSVSVAMDGEQAVRAVAKEAFDLVLMDVQMPGMDGLSATRAIRSSPGPESRVPVIAMSANVLPDEVRRCREAGMDDHVGKPFDEAKLLDAIEFWLRDGAPPATTDPTAIHGGRPGNLLVHLKPPQLVRVLAHLQDELDRAFAGPSETSGERDQLRFEAHSLLAAAAMVGLEGLAEACRELDFYGERKIDSGGCEGFRAALSRARAAAEAAKISVRSLRRAAEDAVARDGESRRPAS